MSRSKPTSRNHGPPGAATSTGDGSNSDTLSLLPSAPTDPSPLPLTKDNAVTSLWAGFGTLYRIPTSSKSKSKSTHIVKHIHMSPADLAAARSSVSDMRKLHSYLAETSFYVYLAPTLDGTQVPMATLDQSKSYMRPDANTNDETHTSSSSSWAAATRFYTDLVLVLSDLSPTYPVDGDMLSPFSVAHTHWVLAWLARFHAHFWRSPRLASTPHLWHPTGSYWHLATRASELVRARRSRGDPWSWIVEGAEYWDQLLTREERWAGQTLVHGDAKAANVLFNEAGTECALVDFQYVGRGCGLRDVVYLVATSVDVSSGVVGYERLVEDGYWRVLVSELGEDRAPGLQECLDMFEVGLLDWCRFMCGWGRWGNVKWVGKVVDGIREKWEDRRQKGWQPTDREYE